MIKKVGWGIPGSPRVALLGLVAMTAMLGPAGAASASHTALGPDGVSIDAAAKRLVYHARDGEQNSITLTETDVAYVFTETAVVPPVENHTTECTVVGGVTTCPKDGIDTIVLFAGDETGPIGGVQDTINVEATPPEGTTIDGGTGNDDITSGAGDETIFGREGIDSVNSGDGRDVITMGPSANDPDFRFQTVIGGDSFDELRYDDRTGPATIDGSDSNLFSRDSDLVNCPADPDVNPTGGCVELIGPDLEKLVGTHQSDEIIGGSLGQVLVGLGGSDVLCGGWGEDTVDYSEHSQGVDVNLDGTIDSDRRHIAPVFSPGLDQYRKARRDCRFVDFDRTVGGEPVRSPVTGNPLAAGALRDCTPDDGAPGEQDCIGDDVEHIIGSEFDDRLTGNSPDVFEGLGPRVEPHGINKIEGRGGDDLIDGRFGPDALSGGEGNDTVTYAERTVPVVAAIDGASNDGTREIQPGCPEELDAIITRTVLPPWDVNGVLAEVDGSLNCRDFDPRTNLYDSIEGDVENVIGGSANDTLGGDDDANRLTGGPGDDYIDGHGGNDQLEGEAGADTILGGDGADAVLGGDDGDVLDGELGDDNVRGGNGGDTVKGGGGADTLGGGEGGDLVDYSDATTPLHVTADGTNNDGRRGEGDNVLPDFEVIIGGIGDDLLVGGPGSEQIMGGDGNDELAGSGGADDMFGGPGADAVTYNVRGAPVFVNLAEPGNDGEPGEGDYVREDVEKVVGGAGDDTLLGDGKVNVLVGSGGNDRLAGAEGDDELAGGVGNDNLSGDVGNDTLFGGDGNDTLFGGDGNDDLKGEAGNDSLDGGLGNDRHTGGPNIDTILYSSRSAGVTVSLDGQDKNGQDGENDFINHDVENVTTGSGADVIDADDNLRGEVRCGAGADLVTVDPDDDVASDCENVRVAALGTRCTASSNTVRMSRSGRIRVRLFCAAEASGRLRLQSVARIRMRKGSSRRIVRIGSRRFSLKAGQRRTITIRASRSARRLIQRKRRLSVRARVSSKAKTQRTTLRTSRVFTVRARR